MASAAAAAGGAGAGAVEAGNAYASTAAGGPHAPRDRDRDLDLLKYAPRLLLAAALAQLSSLRDGVRETRKDFYGASLFVDVSGFSKLGLSLSKQAGGQAAENLRNILNGYFKLLIACIHKQGGSVLFFGGDSIMAFVPAELGRSLVDASACALHAALDIRSMSYSAHGISLYAHTGIGTGRLEMHVLQAGPQAANVLFGGEAILEACDAQRASRGDDIVLSSSAYRLLQLTALAAPLPASPHLCLLSPSASRSNLPARLRAPHASTGSPGTGLCGCGAPARDGEEAAKELLASFSTEVRAIAAGASPGDGFFEGDMRSIFAVFCAFPQLDTLSDKTSARAGEIVRRVHKTASSYGGYVNKIIVDDKGAVALLAFGVPAHEDDATRAVRTALALRDWFEAEKAPFAAGIASGRAFIGPLGAPCRKEWAIVSEAATIAARLLAAARAALASETSTEILCTEEVAEAAMARAGSGLQFESLLPVAAKGFSQPLAVARPSARLDIDRDTVSSSVNSSRRPSLGVDPAAHVPRDPRAPVEASRTFRRTFSSRGRSVFVGREGELEAGQRAVEEAQAGRGQSVVVEADAGYGKTRLLRELQRLCEARGFAVLSSTAIADEAARPLAALRGLLASICRVASASDLEDELVRRGLAAPRDAQLLSISLHSSAPGYSNVPRGEATILQSSSNQNGNSLSADISPRPRSPPTSSLLPPSSLSTMATASASASAGLVGVARVADALARLVKALEEGAAHSGDREHAHASRPRPVAVFLEDAHWFDSASWFVLRSVRDACPRLLLVLSTRPMASPPRDYLIIADRAFDAASQVLAAGAAHQTPEEAEAKNVAIEIGDNDREGSGSKPAAGVSRSRSAPAPMRMLLPHLRPRDRAPTLFLRLGPLSRETAAALLSNMAGRVGARDWPEQVSTNIVDRAEGVPLSIVELFRRQASSGVSVTLPGVPETIERIILSRADALPNDAKTVAKLSAVFSGAFSPEAVCACDPGGLHLSSVLAAFATLRHEHVITRARGINTLDAKSTSATMEWTVNVDSDDESTARREAEAPHVFVHALQRDALYESIPEVQRRELHRRVAAWLEGAPSAPDVTLLALHWSAAGDFMRALPAMEGAAAVARAGGALLESRNMSARVVATIDAHGLAGIPPPLPEGFHGTEELAAQPVGWRMAVPGDVTSRAAAPLQADFPRWRVARAIALANCSNFDFVSGNRRVARDTAMAALETIGSPLRTRHLGGFLGKARLVLRLVKVASALRSAKWHDDAGAAAEAKEGREHKAVIESLYIVWHSALTGESRPGEVPGPIVAVAAAVQAAQATLAAPQRILSYHDVSVLALVPLLVSMLGLGGEEKAEAAHESVHTLAAIIHRYHEGAPAMDMLCLGQRRAAAGRMRDAVSSFSRSVPILQDSGEPIGGIGSLDYGIANLFAGRLDEALRITEEGLNFVSRMAAGATAYVAIFAATIRAIANLWSGNTSAAVAILTTMKHVEEASPAAEARSWTGRVAEFGRALLSLHAGDHDALWEFARSTVLLSRAETQTWHSILILPAAVDYIEYRVFLAHRSQSRPDEDSRQPGCCGWPRRRPRSRAVAEGQASLPPVPSSSSRLAPDSGMGHSGAPNPAAAAPSADPAVATGKHDPEQLLQIACSTLKHLDRLMPLLKPFYHLWSAGRTSTRPQQRLALLRAARAGFERSGLRTYEALACIRLAVAEPDAAAASEAQSAAERIAHETGIGFARLGDSFVSLWPWGARAVVPS